MINFTDISKEVKEVWGRSLFQIYQREVDHPFNERMEILFRSGVLIKVKPHSAKNKGRVLQQWVRDRIIGVFNLEKDDVRSTSSGASGEDILLSPEARKVFPFSVECKNQERLNLWNSYAQAVSNTVEDSEPLLFIKRNHHKPLAVVDAESFINREKYIQELREELRLCEVIIEGQNQQIQNQSKWIEELDQRNIDGNK